MLRINCSECKDLCLLVLGSQLTEEITINDFLSGKVETHVASVPELHKYFVRLSVKKNGTVEVNIEEVKHEGKLPAHSLPNIRNEKLYEALARLSYLYLCITKE